MPLVEDIGVPPAQLAEFMRRVQDILREHETTASFLAHAASGQTASIVGKPEPQLFFTALDRLGEGRTLVIGDRLDSDVLGASRAHLDAALVLTGDTSAEEAAAAKKPRPVAVAANLRELVLV